jgi:hypothetical protein
MFCPKSCSEGSFRVAMPPRVSSATRKHFKWTQVGFSRSAARRSHETAFASIVRVPGEDDLPERDIIGSSISGTITGWHDLAGSAHRLAIRLIVLNPAKTPVKGSANLRLYKSGGIRMAGWNAVQRSDCVSPAIDADYSEPGLRQNTWYETARVFVAGGRYRVGGPDGVGTGA